MRKTLSLVLVAMLGLAAAPSLAADSMAMGGPAMAPMATPSAYRFELAGPIQSTGGKSVVSVRLIHTADRKPVVGALIIQSRADMGPIGMAGMTAPIRALPVASPGVYRFEIANGGVWSKPDKWALSFAAKVQGETATVRGSIVVELKP